MHVISKAEGRADTSEGWGTQPEIRTTWLIDREAGDSKCGAVGIVEFDPRAEQPLHRHPGGEEGSVVIAGSGTAIVAGEENEAGFGSALYAPAGASHAIRAGEEGLTLMVVLSELSAADTGWKAGDVAAGPTARFLRGNEGEELVLDDPEIGFKSVRARWVVDSEFGGSEKIVIGCSQFAVGGAHELHRHPGCAEFFYVLEGEGAHLDEAGEEVPAPQGTIGLMTRGSWHGFRNKGDVEVRSVFGYLGVDSFDAGGYELPGADDGTSS